MGDVIELNPQPSETEREFVTAVEIVKQARITYRQLDYWTRTGLLVPSNINAGAGNHRHYPLDQLARAKAISAFLRAGLSLSVLREHLDTITTVGAFTYGPVTITYTPEEAPE